MSRRKCPGCNKELLLCMVGTNGKHYACIDCVVIWYENSSGQLIRETADLRGCVEKCINNKTLII